MRDLNNYYLLFVRVKGVGIHGIEYRPGCDLRLHEMDDVDDLENEYPVYGQVDEIIVWEDLKFFILTELETLCFHNHFIASDVDRSDNKAVVLRHDLPWHVVEKDTSCIEDTIQRDRIQIFFLIELSLSCHFP